MIITLIKQVIASATWKDKKKKNPFTILFICGQGKVASKGWLNSWRRGGLKLKQSRWVSGQPKETGSLSGM